MMTDTAAQQQTDINGQILVTYSEREALIQKLAAKWTLDLSKRIEMLAYTKSNGVKSIYFKLVQSYYQQVQNAYQNRNQQQQQQQQQTSSQASNNNGEYLNQQLNLSQQPSVPMLVQTQHPLNTTPNQQIRCPSTQQLLQFRMKNPQTGVINTQPSVLNHDVRLHEPQKFNSLSLNAVPCTLSSSSSLSSTTTAAAAAAAALNSISTPSTVQTMDLSQNFTVQQPMNNTSLNDYLSQPSILQSRYLTQQAMNSRVRPTMHSIGNFSQSSTSNNANDILHQFVVGNPPTNSMASSSSSLSLTPALTTSTMITPMTNTPSTGDRLLQQILLSNNDGISNKIPIQNRQPSFQQSRPSIMSQPIRSVNTTTNSNITSSINPARSSLISQQLSTAPSATPMPTIVQTSNIQVPPPNNIIFQRSPLNNNNSTFSVNIQTIPSQSSSSSSTTTTTTNNSASSVNNYSSPINRSLPISGSGAISNPDEETINLIKYLKENLSKLQAICLKYANEGQLDKSRNAQAIHQQMVQFINNPTYESLSNAKHIRDNLERASSRSQQSNVSLTTAPIPNNPTASQVNNFHQFEKAINEYISRDPKERLFLNKLFVEPLNNVVDGFPHKKIRLDNETNLNKVRTTENFSSLNQSSLLFHLNDELVLLPANIFLIEYLPLSHTIVNNEFNDEYLSKNGIVLRCKLSELPYPLVPPLRLRISTRYPQEQPEILSLSQTMPPKLEFTDDHPFFQQISALFVSYLFKLPPRHTVTDILNIWRQSVKAAM
ncbi:unnamed protein product [Rotaria magnacalcarata]|uniref:ARC105/Med15 mediator subunit C-terminal domain-containing protein n=1 Tax=Rotaria magnacalcarata TaxID=392030 RepID=A0A816RWN1_9BILA|nr:unnamed protein product [Rotaria magnacalcarata]CAF3863134.1 unnamed protein product [Rotaria magnacalcarata]